MSKENKKNNITEVVFILDRSGSMAGLEKDTIGGFNAAIAKLKGNDEEGTTFVSLLMFDNEVEVINDRAPLQYMRPLEGPEYQVGGCTALMDAIGGAIHHIGNIHKYARLEDVPDHTIFFITTDGMENASRYYDSRKVKTMIQRQSEKYGWEFIFMAANIDAVETAESIGIRRERAVNVTQSSVGRKMEFEAMADAAMTLQKGCSLDGGKWREKIDKVVSGVVSGDRSH